MERSEDRDFADGAAMGSIMQLLKMNGSYPLTDEAVDETVTRTSPGNYALGYMDGTTFRVFTRGMPLPPRRPGLLAVGSACRWTRRRSVAWGL
jgi:hypothetical protein